MDLPIGNWTANFSGVEGTLVLETFRQGGDFGGKMLRPDIEGGMMLIAGMWDGTAQKLTFAARHPGNQTVDDEWLEAYLIVTPRNAVPGQDVTLTLVGSITVINITQLPKYNSANARRATFGWSAEMRVIS